MISEKLHIGTSGWSYKHWQGIFYPSEIRPDRYLEFYMTKFSCVELNSSFYHLPRKSTISGWKERTPETFRFCLKMSRFITHQLQLVDTEEALVKFFDIFRDMRERLGPVLVQLHPAIQFDRSLIKEFFDILKEKYQTYRFAIEARNNSWINDTFFELLSVYGMGFVIADSGNRYPGHEAVTSDFVYLRFHGREHLYASDYSEEELSIYAEKIVGWLGEGKEIWAFFNNDFYGYAVKNAQQLISMIGQPG
jgi:uncharacterized protein YecE (DUF72 family)